MIDVQMGRPVMTIRQFCESHGISKEMFYRLLGQGRGPRMIHLGPKTIRISIEAAADWRRDREQDAA